MAIDANAFARGARQALEDNIREDEAAYNRAVRMQQWQENMQARRAAEYLSSVAGNRQLAADHGISPTEFLIQQRRQILDDMAKRGVPQGVQSRVLSELANMAVVEASGLKQRGDVGEANRLMETFGQQRVFDDLDQAKLRGDVKGIADALKRRGANVEYLPESGNVRFNGVELNGAEWARQVIAGGEGSAMGGLNAVAAYQERVRQEKAQDELFNRALALSGYRISPSGVLEAVPSAVDTPSAEESVAGATPSTAVAGAPAGGAPAGGAPAGGAPAGGAPAGGAPAGGAPAGGGVISTVLNSNPSNMYDTTRNEINSLVEFYNKGLGGVHREPPVFTGSARWLTPEEGNRTSSRFQQENVGLPPKLKQLLEELRYAAGEWVK
jgi:hypothetical protein